MMMTLKIFGKRLSNIQIRFRLVSMENFKRAVHKLCHIENLEFKPLLLLSLFHGLIHKLQSINF